MQASWMIRKKMLSLDSRALKITETLNAKDALNDAFRIPIEPGFN